MRVILATSNRGKVREIKEFWRDLEVIPYTDLIDAFEIEENGLTFSENAIIKAKAVRKSLLEKGFNEIIISDDSGISVEALSWAPNIYSARYGGVNASGDDNLNKMIKELKAKNVSQSRAYYTAAIAIIDKNEKVYTTHGWMHGDVIDERFGDKGFGYDPIFIPKGESQTLGVLDDKIKEGYSHRIKALKLAKIILDKLH